MFISTFRKMWSEEGIVEKMMPDFSGTRIMMMPVRLGSLDGVPAHFQGLIDYLYGLTESRWLGHIGYLTIDERVLEPGETLRRSGLHVDGYYHGRCGAWGGGGTWGSVGNGMLTVSSTSHCRAWLGRAYDEPDAEGGCNHVDLDDLIPYQFKANKIYWVDGACVHESLPVDRKMERQFIRLSMPSNGPWFEGYTENPTGIKPSAEVLPRRQFM